MPFTTPIAFNTQMFANAFDTLTFYNARDTVMFTYARNTKVRYNDRAPVHSREQYCC
jgi:hypothetical protein